MIHGVRAAAARVEPKVPNRACVGRWLPARPLPQRRKRCAPSRDEARDRFYGTPVPVRGTSTVPPGSPLMTRVVLAGPTLVGLKKTCWVHDAPGASVALFWQRVGLLLDAMTSSNWLGSPPCRVLPSVVVS